MGLDVGLFFFFFLLSCLVVVDCGFCDQRQARMVVIGLGGVAGFSVGLAVKNSCGTWGNIRIAVASLGLFKISWGKNLMYCHIGWLAFLMVFAFKWLSTVMLYGSEVCSNTKIDVGQLH